MGPSVVGLGTWALAAPAMRRSIETYRENRGRGGTPANHPLSAPPSSSLRTGRGSLREAAAVDTDLGAGDVGRIVAGEHGHDACDVRRHAGALRRHHPLEQLPVAPL